MSRRYRSRPPAEQRLGSEVGRVSRSARGRAVHRLIDVPPLIRSCAHPTCPPPSHRAPCCACSSSASRAHGRPSRRRADCRTASPASTTTHEPPPPRYPTLTRRLGRCAMMPRCRVGKGAGWLRPSHAAITTPSGSSSAASTSAIHQGKPCRHPRRHPHAPGRGAMGRSRRPRRVRARHHRVRPPRTTPHAARHDARSRPPRRRTRRSQHQAPRLRRQ